MQIFCLVSKIRSKRDWKLGEEKKFICLFLQKSLFLSLILFLSLSSILSLSLKFLSSNFFLVEQVEKERKKKKVSCTRLGWERAPKKWGERITKRERQKEREKVVSLSTGSPCSCSSSSFWYLLPSLFPAPGSFLLSPSQKVHSTQQPKEKRKKEKREVKREREKTTVSRCSILQRTEATKNGSRFSLSPFSVSFLLSFFLSFFFFLSLPFSASLSPSLW